MVGHEKYSQGNTAASAVKGLLKEVTSSTYNYEPHPDPGQLVEL